MKLRTVKRKVVELDVIDVNSRQLQEVEIKGHYGVFTELRVDKSTLPEGVNCYELRHGEDDSYPAAMEQNVRINYFGAVLMTDKMELGEDGYVELRELINEVNAIGNNINQITRNHNSKLYREEDRQLLSAYMKKLNLLVKEAVETIGNQ